MVERKSAVHHIVEALKYILLIALALLMLLPFINLAATSFSGESAVIAGRVTFWPISPTLATYRWVLKGGSFLNAFKVSAIITLGGGLASVLLTAMSAYPLSRTGFRGRKPILYLWVFVMLFSGGMIPTYMLYRYMGLMDKIVALVLPGLISSYNLFLIKNYFEALPESLEEAARIDGASNLRVLFQVILPISMPMLATITLFYAVGYWNDYFTARLYINSPGNRPLQLYLYDMINNALAIMNQGETGSTGSITADDYMNLTAESVRAAAIVLSTVPILCVYPFLQKYFVTGIVVGSVKG